MAYHEQSSLKLYTSLLPVQLTPAIAAHSLILYFKALWQGYNMSISPRKTSGIKAIMATVDQSSQGEALAQSCTPHEDSSDLLAINLTDLKYAQNTVAA
jgi:hypothetical protein